MHRVVQEQIERILAANLAANSSEPAGWNPAAAAHLSKCAECHGELSAMQNQLGLLRQLRTPSAEVEPRAGFYARVMERIEAEGPISVWNLFMESAFGKRIAMASLALAVVLGVYLVSSEHTADDPIIEYSAAYNGTAAAQQATIQVSMQAGPAQTLQAQAGDFGLADPFTGMQAELLQNELPVSGPAFDPPADDAVLTNLMTYREQ